MFTNFIITSLCLRLLFSGQFVSTYKHCCFVLIYNYFFEQITSPTNSTVTHTMQIISVTIRVENIMTKVPLLYLSLSFAQRFYAFSIEVSCSNKYFIYSHHTHILSDSSNGSGTLGLSACCDLLNLDYYCSASGSPVFEYCILYLLANKIR